MRYGVKTFPLPFANRQITGFPAGRDRMWIAAPAMKNAERRLKNADPGRRKMRHSCRVWRGWSFYLLKPASAGFAAAEQSLKTPTDKHPTKSTPMKTHLILASFTAILTGSLATPAQAGGRRCVEAFRAQQAAAEAAIFYGTAGVTDLMRAAVTGDINAGLAALRKGDAINARTSETNAAGAHVGGLTALMMAAGHVREPMVRWLIEQGATVNAQSANGQTALGRAVLAGESEATVSIVNALVTAGADPLADRPKNLTLTEVARRAGYTRLAAVLTAPVVKGGKQ